MICMKERLNIYTCLNTSNIVILVTFEVSVSHVEVEQDHMSPSVLQTVGGKRVSLYLCSVKL